MSSWKTAYRSIYYDGAPEPDDPDLSKASTALLVIDVQNTYLARPDRASLSAEDQRRYDAWTPFHERMHQTVLPRTKDLLQTFRESGIECLFARIACHTKNGRDRSLSQKMPGWNNLLLPKDELPSQIVPELAPVGDEIVVTKTTDSALTGSNLRLILTNLGIKTVVCCGIFTDQCVCLDRQKPGGRELQRRRRRRLLRGGLGRASSQGTRDHEHDLLPRHVEQRT